MHILGIDPGLATVGYAVIDAQDRSCKLLEYGCIKTAAGMPLPERLLLIYKELTGIIEQFQPEEMAIEELFFSKNVTNGLLVSQARGVEILCAVQQGIPVYEYKPMHIKQAITGYGRADKKQMQLNIKMLFSMRDIPKPDDAADAIAVAFCHAMSHRFKEQYAMR